MLYCNILWSIICLFIYLFIYLLFFIFVGVCVCLCVVILTKEQIIIIIAFGKNKVLTGKHQKQRSMVVWNTINIVMRYEILLYTLEYYAALVFYAGIYIVLDCNIYIYIYIYIFVRLHVHIYTSIYLYRQIDVF